MYKKYFLLLLIVSLLNEISFAQNNSIINGLQNRLKRETQPEKIADLQLSLASEIKQNQPESAVILAKSAFQFFNTQKNN